MFGNLTSRLTSKLTYANVASTTALVLVIGGGGAAVAASMVPATASAGSTPSPE